MNKLHVIDRTSGQVITEDIWGEWWLRLFYGDGIFPKTIGRILLHVFFRWPIMSWLMGKYYDTKRSCRLIAPFCERFHIDMKESVLPISEFTSFNDFFTRRLTLESRPQALDADVLTMPADGRYSFIQNCGTSHTFPVKGEQMNLEQILGCKVLAAKFCGGTAVFCRLCPADCHRFYFPIQGKATSTKWIHGSLFSVNPLATNSRPWIWWKNRRALTLIETEEGRTIAYLEVGATNCGSIVQNFVADSWVKKGQEKGYFRLGGSAIILLFEPGHIFLDKDLLALSQQGLEVLCQIGQPLARMYAAHV